MSVSRFATLLLVGVMPVCAGTSRKNLLQQQPLSFESNAGQLSSDVQFRSRWSDYSVELRAGEVCLRTAAGSEPIRISFPGSNTRASVSGVEPLTATSYLLGNQRKAWKTNVPQYRKVRYENVWPGVDLVYYGVGKQLEFDFVLRPGTDPKQIRLRFAGVDKLTQDAEGSLLLGDGLKLRTPAVYQATPGGTRRTVAARYRLSGSAEAVFSLGEYDTAKSLVIDPVLAYTSYLGGSSSEVANAVGVDPRGRIWIAGTTASSSLPIAGSPVHDVTAGKRDVFVACFDPSKAGAESLVYSTYLGGTADEDLVAMAIDQFGQVYIAGTTSSTDFPLAGPSAQTAFGGDRDVFAMRINPAVAGGDALEYSTVFGGALYEQAYGMTIDSAGSIYVAGVTTSDDLPKGSIAGAQTLRRGGYDGFVIKLSPFKSVGLDYASYMGGAGSDFATSVAVDKAGNVYVGGYSYSGDFPISGPAYQPNLKGADGFVMKFDLSRSGLDTLVYGTYFGGGKLDVVQRLAIDSKDRVILVGYTFSDDLPVTALGYQSRLAGDADVFLARLDLSLPAGEALTYSTYFGGAGADVVYGLVLDTADRVTISGYTYSQDFPLVQPLQSKFGGWTDGFIASLDLNASREAAVLYSTYLGGVAFDVAYGVAVDGRGNTYVAGYTYASGFPIGSGGRQVIPGGNGDAFVAQLVP